MRTLSLTGIRRQDFRDTDWWDETNCVGAGLDQFFPHTAVNFSANSASSQWRDHVETALSYCHGSHPKSLTDGPCVGMERCSQEGAREEGCGIWGGRVWLKGQPVTLRPRAAPMF